MNRITYSANPTPEKSNLGASPSTSRLSTPSSVTQTSTRPCARGMVIFRPLLNSSFPLLHPEIYGAKQIMNSLSRGLDRSL